MPDGEHLPTFSTFLIFHLTRVDVDMTYQERFSRERLPAYVAQVPQLPVNVYIMSLESTFSTECLVTVTTSEL